MLPAAFAALALAPAPAEAKVIGASLFKNGYAVLTRQADVAAGGQEIVFNEIPNATLGSFWLASEGGLIIQSAVTGQVVETVKEPLGSLNEIIAANVGKQVMVNLADPRPGETQTLEGKLISAAGDIIVVQAAGMDAVINKSRVARLSVLGGGGVYDRDAKRSRRVMRLQTNGKAGKVYLMSLERGLSWSPAYAVDLIAENKLSLRARGTIINDLAPLEGIEVKLITGFPNIRYLSAFDPFTTTGPTAALKDMSFAPAPAMGNALQTQRAAFGGGGGGFGGDLAETGGGEGFAAEDLFFYRQPGVTLQPGDRGYYELFQSELEHRHVYTADLSGWSRENPDRPDVWHTIRMKNNTSRPFTTGPAMVVKDGEVLAQDELAYVPVGAEGSLRLTKSLSIILDQEDEEISRERGAITDREGQPVFDLVTYRTKMSAQNLKDREAQFEVTRSLEGAPGGMASAGVALLQMPVRGNALNAPLRMTWSPKVAPGGKAEAEYTWTIYVSSVGR
jgi:hypothetical protein